MGERALFLNAGMLESVECCSCGVKFAMPCNMLANRREDKELFYCPSGHAQSFRKSESDTLRERLAAAEKTVELARASAARERTYREQAERSRDAMKGVVTRIKNRVGNGVCPCCNRTFQNLMRHMSTKHPGYAHEGAESESVPTPPKGAADGSP